MKHADFAPIADIELEEIWYYSFKNWGAVQADSYRKDITAACDDLANGRKHGRPASDAHPDCMKYLAGSHYIIFRLTDEGIEVLRILHQAMDPEPRLEAGQEIS